MLDPCFNNEESSEANWQIKEEEEENVWKIMILKLWYMYEKYMNEKRKSKQFNTLISIYSEQLYFIYL